MSKMTCTPSSEEGISTLLFVPGKILVTAFAEDEVGITWGDDMNECLMPNAVFLHLVRGTILEARLTHHVEHARRIAAKPAAPAAPSA